MKSYGLRRLISLALACALLLPLAAPVTAEATEAENTSQTTSAAFRYYYDQLLTDDAKAIYGALARMRDSGQLKTGTYTVDLVAEQFLENKAYEKNALMADFIAARDAFMLDNNLFYVDFDKLSLTMVQKDGNNHQITLGIGRDETYLQEGFIGDVSEYITAFNGTVNALAAEAKQAKTMQDQLKAAYDAVINTVTYKLEAHASQGNAYFVRDPYGALVRGEAVCEGYARALKAVLDAMEIDNVLVQGMYVDDSTNKLEPHMWNYVRMDDHRWYLVDATMGDSGAGNANTDYFLRGGLDSVLEFYQPSGIISLSSNSFAFNYPDLSAARYQAMTNAFTVQDNTHYVSYHNMGLTKTKEQGKYILCSHNGAVWYYAENLMQTNLASMGHGTAGQINLATQNIEFDTYFHDLSESAYFAITNIPPGNRVFDPSEQAAYYLYTAGLDQIYDQTKIGDAIDYDTKPPYIVEKIPYNSHLEQGKTYSIQVVFSEPLKKANTNAAAGLAWAKEIPTASFRNFSWSEENPSTVTFELTTAPSYGRTINYYFVLENLVGTHSGKAPSAIGFCTYNNNSFACPKLPANINYVHSNTPALISDSNLADNNWTDAHGTSLSKDLPNRLALVATEVSNVTAGQMVNTIESTLGENSVLASQTYDISLSLCSSQVAYITGKPVKVFVPFPDGYNAASAVTYKAYHFAKDGTAEEIDCVTTQFGIIMMCKAFSPFTVVATAQETASAEKKVIVSAVGNGTVSNDLLKIQNSSSATVTITANEGYVIDEILLNGNPIQADENGKVTLSYHALLANGNILEASFIRETIPVDENPFPEAPPPETPDTPNNPDSPVSPENKPSRPSRPSAPAVPEVPEVPETPGLPQDPAPSFSDVPESHWAADVIGQAAALGLIKGVGNGGFDPEGLTTRAQILTMLARHAGADTSGDPLAQGMAWGQEAGITDGSAPDGNVTREQLAALLYRYAGSPVFGNDLHAFGDADSVSLWAQPAMAWAVECGIINGMTPDTLSPGGTATRAQVAAMLMRVLSL